jgi:hypothetical protein
MPRRSGSASGPVQKMRPNQKYRDAQFWYDADNKDNFTTYKLLIADVVGGSLEAVPRGVMAAGNVMEGAVAASTAQGRHRPRAEPPREVLQEDGRYGALGALASDVACRSGCIKMDKA